MALGLYSALCGAIALRIVILILGFPDTVNTVHAILVLSNPLVWPLTYLPAANREVLGLATLADLTAAIVLLAAPLPFLGRQRQARL